MNVAAVIAEYNPFHHGHAWQYREIRRICGEDTAIINVMSGEFTQRGEPAILPKFVRGDLAIKMGSDLVLELPLPFACSAAGSFAAGAVRLLAATGLRMNVFCGAEDSDRPDIFYNIAKILIDEPKIFEDELHLLLDSGNSFAVARSRAVIKFLSSLQPDWYLTALQEGFSFETFFKSSNNILALEYTVAILRCQLSKQLTLHFLPRQGQAEKDKSLTTAPGTWLSGTALRQAILSTSSTAALLRILAGKMPAHVLGEILLHHREHSIPTCNSLSLPLFARLRVATREELSCALGGNEGLLRAAQILLQKQGRELTNWTDLAVEVTDKRRPTGRVNRAFCAFLLNIDQNEFNLQLKAGPSYIRPLAYSKRGRYLLRLLRQKATLPLINNASDFLEYLPTDAVRQQGELCLRAADLIAYSLQRPGGTEFNEFARAGKYLSGEN